MANLSDAVAQAIGRNRSSSSYMGTVTAINPTAAALSVDIGTGVPLAGVRWISSYAPALNDFVVVLRVGGGWWVLGKNSKNLSGVGSVVWGGVVVDPYAIYAGVRPDGSPSWAWTAAGPATYQGTESWSGTTHRTLYMYGALTSAIPSGATIQSVKLRMTKWADDNVANAQLTEPRIFAHANTASPVGDATWVTGYGPLSVEPLSSGQSAQWDLPSGWVSALLANTIRGIGLNADAVSDYSLWDRASGRLTVTYTTPA